MRSNREESLQQQESKSDDPSLYRHETLQNVAEQFSQHLTHSQLLQISPTALAYLGDAVYELYVRSLYLLPSQRPESYHRLVVAKVRAETQAQLLRSLSPYLNSTESDIVRKGRNAAKKRSRRVDPHIYQQATSFETLIGYLYLSDMERLKELLGKLELKRS
ncbi:MAG: ribonuclease III domain-containing protein [Cyanobacteria bacterium P01_A01_bin.45]